MGEGGGRQHSKLAYLFKQSEVQDPCKWRWRRAQVFSYRDLYVRWCLRQGCGGEGSALRGDGLLPFCLAGPRLRDDFHYKALYRACVEDGVCWLLGRGLGCLVPP